MQHFIIFKNKKKTLILIVIDSDWQVAYYNDSKLDCNTELMKIYSYIQKVIFYFKFEVKIATK